MDAPDKGFQAMCRTCLIQDQNFRSIFDSIENPLKIYEMLATTAPQLLILSSDQLPKQICLACLNKLDIAYRFQQMCINSERELRRMLSGTDLLTLSMPTVKKDATTTSKGDLLLVEELATMQKCIKIEETNVEMQNADVEEISGSQEATAKAELNNLQERKNVPDSVDGCSENDGIYDTNDAEEQAVKSTRTRKQSVGTVKSHTLARTSNIHNETGVDEIEKPNMRNRRKASYSCPQCDKVFDRPYRLKRHAGVHAESRSFQCEICMYRYSTVNQLAHHKLVHDKSSQTSRPPPPEGYQCFECPRRFEKRESLSAHQQSHRKADPNQIFKCDFCPKKFHQFSALVKHGRTHPENQRFKCTQCDKAFGLHAHLTEHMNKHSGLKTFACIHCNKAFRQKSTLREHQRTHSGEKPFLCSQCGKAFKSISNMRQHLLRHSGERRYQCPECPSKFACQSDQLKHMSTHSDVKPHVCDICGSSFTRLYTLNKHKHIHTGERPFKCDECDMTFVFIDHMRRHKRKHTGEKPYKCKFCDRAYAESGDLNKHLRTHVGEKTYRCDQCSEKFKYQLELREHQRQHFKQQQQLPVTNESSEVKPTFTEKLKTFQGDAEV